jgi:hypothetical protein
MVGLVTVRDGTQATVASINVSNLHKNVLDNIHREQVHFIMGCVTEAVLPQFRRVGPSSEKGADSAKPPWKIPPLFPAVRLVSRRDIKNNKA